MDLVAQEPADAFGILVFLLVQILLRTEFAGTLETRRTSKLIF
jgi:hypothetical protein